MLAVIKAFLSANPLRTMGLAAGALALAWGLGQVQGRLDCRAHWRAKLEAAEIVAANAAKAAEKSSAASAQAARAANQNNDAVAADIQEQANALDPNDVCVPAGIVDRLRELR